MVTAQQIIDAHMRIQPYIKRTPVITSSYFNTLTGAEIYFKCENLQEIGAFKMRGAMNAVLGLTDEERRRGVATHSSGNHAQALARAASILGIRAYVVMPENAQAVKKEGVASFGAQIFECPPTLEGRESVLARVLKETDAEEIHPFNNFGVIAGQATAARELFESVPSLDIVLTPVGGGGLLSGTALAAQYFSPATEVIGAEPSGADDAYRSMKSGTIEKSQANSIADGLLSNLGEKTFAIINEHVKEIIRVGDDEIIRAMGPMLEKVKLLIEPSAAVPVAAMLKSNGRWRGKRIGIILSGGNIGLKRFTELVNATKEEQ